VGGWGGCKKEKKNREKNIEADSLGGKGKGFKRCHRPGLTEKGGTK